MIQATNPSFIKQEFISTLSKTEQNSIDVEALLQYFCEISWWLDNEQLECFDKLKKFMIALPKNLKIEFIPKLVEKSKNYPKLVILAEELFNTLNETEQKDIDIPMIYWTFDDAYTLISENEYRYRTAYGKSVWSEGDSYRRPSQAMDFLCYEKVLDMICKSHSSHNVILTESSKI